MYCDFGDPKVDTRFYNEVKNFEELKTIVTGMLDEFNGMTNKRMNLVLFRYIDL